MKKRILYLMMAAAIVFVAGCKQKSPEYRETEKRVAALRDSVESAKNCADLNRKLNSSFQNASGKYVTIKDSTERAEIDRQLGKIDRILAKKMKELNCGTL